MKLPFFKHRKKIEFFTILPGVEKMYPVTNAGEAKPSWFYKEAQNYKEYKSKCPFALLNRTFKRTTILKCPGVIKTLERGYVLYNCIDFIIEPKENGHVAFHLPPGYHLGENNFYAKNKYIEIRKGPDLFGINPLPGCYDFHLKLNLPWKVRAPKDIVFLELPLLYGDIRSIIPVGGTLDPQHSININPVFWVAKTETPIHISAGTPLLQLIPIPRKEYKADLVIRQQTNQEVQKQNEYTFLREHSFDTNISFQTKVADAIWSDE